MKISESFYSLQLEGVTSGVPAYFIRLQDCNLMCGGREGQLLKEGKASWYCDSEKVWRHGQDVSNEELYARIKSVGQLQNVRKGITHLVWTGGEPTLPRNRKDIGEFLKWFDSYCGESLMHNEIETNGAVIVEPGWYDCMEQINCSPKLSNSGMDMVKRINPVALRQIMLTEKYWFKFVVNEERDIKEMQRCYEHPFMIPVEKIILMPGVDNREGLADGTRFVYEMAKKYGYRATTRGQVLAWDKVTGV